MCCASTAGQPSANEAFCARVPQGEETAIPSFFKKGMAILFQRLKRRLAASVGMYDAKVRERAAHFFERG